MIIVGAKEEENETIDIRLRDSGENFSMTAKEFIEKVNGEIASRS